MQPLRVLLTNITLATRTGTELYVRDLALALAARGHIPMVFSPCLGPIAQELSRAAIEVVHHPRRLSNPPDLIHGHHWMPTMEALLHHPRVPCIFICHDFVHDSDAPPIFPRVLRYIAVDENCRRRLLRHHVPEHRIRVVSNGVDLSRFAPRPALPSRPARALIFSNYASERTHLGAVRQACQRTGIMVDVIGARAGVLSERPESILGQYDIVFAKGRCALEALAVGAAVILCDWPGSGPLVTVANVDRLRRWNFGWPELRGPLSPAALVREIDRYDPDDAAAVSRRVREEFSLDAMVEELMRIYREVILEHDMAAYNDRSDAERAAARAYWAASRSERIRNRIKACPIMGPLVMTVRRTLLKPASGESGGGRIPIRDKISPELGQDYRTVQLGSTPSEEPAPIASEKRFTTS